MTTIDEMTRGRREAERLRPYRIKNYATKRAADFTCLVDGCAEGSSILVVELDGDLTTRCQRHLEGEIQPGQWNAR